MKIVARTQNLISSQDEPNSIVAWRNQPLELSGTRLCGNLDSIPAIHP